MKLRNSTTTFASALTLASMVACGGGGDSSEDTGAGGGDGLANTGETRSTVQVPTSCSAQSDCPDPYVCVLPPPTLVSVLDEGCYGQCSPGCDLAPEFKDSCLSTCRQACTTQVPQNSAGSSGTCERDQGGTGGAPGEGGGSQASGSGGSSGGTEQPSITWAGTWTADVAHTSDCNWSSAKQSGQQSYTITLKVTGSNASPSATVSNGFALEGTGASDHMNLTGDFPFRSWKGEVATTNSLNSPNNATIKITNVESASKASGTIEGSWDAGGGWTCTAKSGTVTLSK